MNAVAEISEFDRLEAVIATLPPADMETVHHFADGVYVRELRMAAGTILTGKEHREECLNIVVGDITVYNLADRSSRRITGHEIFKSPAGTRRAGVVHRPTIWTTIHVTKETDLAKIEAAVIRPHVNPMLENKPEEISCHG